MNNDKTDFEQINPRCLAALVGTKILTVDTDVEGGCFTVEVPSNLFDKLELTDMDTDFFDDCSYRWIANRPFEVGVRFRGYYGTAYIPMDSKWEDLLALCHVFEHKMDPTVWLDQLHPQVKVWICGEPEE